MRQVCIGSAILAGVLAWTAVPAGCVAALGALGAPPRSGVAPTPPAHPAEAVPASSSAAPAAEGQGSGGAPPAAGAPAGGTPAAGAGPSPATALWIVPGVVPGVASGGTLGGQSGPGQAGVPVREARLMVAAAADELDALVSAARGEAPRGGPGGQAAFWSAAGALQRALADLDGALAAGDPAFFSILGEAQRSLVAVQVACRRAGTWREGRRAAETGASGSAAGEATARRMTALVAAVGRLAGASSREAAPAAQQGGGLSAAQALQLQGMARAARRWRAALPALAAAARQEGDAALQSELARLDALLRQVAAEQSLTLAAYLAAVSASNQALALWSANAAYLDPGEQQASQQADAAASDLTTAADTGFVFGADLSGGTAWAYAEGPPAGDAAAPPGDAGTAGGGGPGDGGGGPGDADGRSGDAGGPSGDMDVRPGVAGGSPGDAGGGPGVAGGRPGDAGGGPGDAGGRPGDAGGDEWTGLPGEVSAAAAGAGAAGAEAVPGAPGAASSSGPPGWVVIHGGPDATWQPESSPPAEAPPRFALQLGDAQDEALSPGEWATGADDDAGSDASLPIDWKEICRPWQPDAGRSICPGPAPPGPGDVEP
jgi:hypothetical protein